MRRASIASTCCRCAAPAARPLYVDRRRSAGAGRVRLRPDPQAPRGRRAAAQARRCCSAMPAPATCSRWSCSRRKIPFVKYGGLKFLEAAHVKDMLAVLRWADNPRNTMAAFRVLQLLPGMGPANAQRIVAELEQHAAATWPCSKRRSQARRRAAGPAQARQAAATLTEPQRPWPGQVRPGARLVPAAPGAHLRADRTRASATSTSSSRSPAQFPSRERFITELTLDPPNATGDLSGSPLQDEDYLVLSTVHSAKGMEWDTVYVLNVVDGSFPSEFSTGRAELIDEERRLLYVAMTRARNELHLCAAAEVPADAAAAATAMRTSTARAAASSPRRCSSAASRARSRARRTPRD